MKRNVDIVKQYLLYNNCYYYKRESYSACNEKYGKEQVIVSVGNNKKITNG